MPARVELDYNTVYQSNNFGPFIIIGEEGQDSNHHRKVRIKFINTGYETIVLLSNIRKGNVKDDSIKPLRDVSDFSKSDKDKFIINKLRTIWHSMFKRCEDENHKEFNAYGGIGVSIDPSWRDFNTFLNDCKYLPQYDKFYNDPYNYQLDKDYLQLEIPKCKRIYSKDTCVFISNRDNTNLRVLEYARSNELTSKYFGVTKINERYLMGITFNGNKISIYFDDEIAAANAYNYWFEKLHLYDIIRLYNDVPYMDIDEWTSHINMERNMVDFV
jgi:hypothetical protein